MESIIAAVIAGVLSAGASVYAANVNNARTVAVLSERLDNYKKSTDDKIDSLKDHVDKHNNVIERTYALEAKVDMLSNMNGGA